MIKLKRLTIALAALLIASATAWAQTEQTVAVTPVTGQTNQWTMTMPAANVTLNVEYEPEFTATFKALTANTIGTAATVKLDDVAIDTLSAENNKLNGIYEGQTITLTAQTGYKFRSVTATKGAASAYTMAADAAAGDVGKLICTDGHIHAYNADADCTKSRVAMIVYVGSTTDNATYTHGLALALADESDNGMAWGDAKTACSGKNTSAKVTSASWMLPSRAQWETMGATEGDITWSALRDGFSGVGGTNLESGRYWSSTEDAGDPDGAWMFRFDNGSWQESPKNATDPLVRACLAF